MTGWALAKYVLLVAGVALVLAADRLGVRRLGWVGLGLILVAFLLRFVHRRQTGSGSSPPASSGAP